MARLACASGSGPLATPAWQTGVTSAQNAAGERRPGELFAGLTAKLLLLSLITVSFITLSILPGVAAPTVWVQPSLARVGPDAPAGSGASINLYAAKGESESFQIIVRAPTGGLTGVNVVAPDLDGPEFTLYREHYVYLSRGSSDWATNVNKPLGAGWYPDGLIPFVNPATGADLTGATLDAVPFNLAAGKNQAIWVDVYVPRTANAGQYQGTFTVTSNQGSATVNLNLTVWNFELPVTPALDSSFLYWTIGDQVQPRQELLRNRIMPTNVSASSSGSLLSEGLGAVNLGFWSGADGSTCTITNSPPSASTVAAKAASYPDGLHLYAYTADEISHCSGLLPTMAQYADALHSAGVDQLITMPPTVGWEDVVDIWVELPKQYAASSVQAALGRGDEVWSYNCLQQDDYSPKWLLDYAPINYRIQPGFINQSLGMTGLLYWRVDFWTSDAWNDLTRFSASYPGEGVLVYPAAQVGLSGVVPSLRLKWLRDGADDYDYMQLLKERGEGDWALNLARTIGPDWRNWTRDPNALESARRQLGEKLNSLSAPEEHELTVSAGANPTTIPSAGQTQLQASASDTLGHDIASWSWSDGGGGGAFLPSAAAQNPTYKAAENSTGSSRAVELTVTATCDGPSALSDSDSVVITVQSTSHEFSVSASASPSTVASGGVAALSATASDSLDHGVASWSWSDGGAGGVFAPSAAVANPSYTAPANAGDTDLAVTLMVSATCDGPSPLTAQDTISVMVTPAAHLLSVTAGVSPTTVTPGGVADLSATALDTHNHSIAAWQWSDGGAGGVFSPSASVQNPSYQAPRNTSGEVLSVVFMVSATCAGPPPISASDTVTLSVLSEQQELSVTVTEPQPSTVESEGLADLSADASGSVLEEEVSWEWDDAAAGGSFSPSPYTRAPKYRAPKNKTGQPMSVTLKVTGVAASPAPMSDTAATSITVAPAAHTLVVRAYANPSIVSWKGKTYLSAYAEDSLDHEIAEWHWSDNGAGGSFTPSANIPNPTYRASANDTVGQEFVILEVTAVCAGEEPISARAFVSILIEEKTNIKVRALKEAESSAESSDQFTITPWAQVGEVVYPTFSDVPKDSWAYEAVEACYDAGLVSGYPDGSYGLDLPVTRALAAVYLARALAGGDELVPAGPAEASFADVPADHWAYRYVEYARARGLIAGFPDGTFRPQEQVTRAQTAAFLARALATPTETGGLVGYEPPATPTFSDVPSGHWAYSYVEYLAAAGVVSGYEDARYLPDGLCTRGQIAVYFSRAFELSRT
ncbi:MAG: S-layer homology domain-containing protein [Armatimonadetes bacterium]|nr:S-layer homology domain-containing protein [Armatimonadota bacterium]